MNAANEVAVQLFLEERLPFNQIPSVIEDALANHTRNHQCTLDDIILADRTSREHVMHQVSLTQ
ncbi:MAG: 1-deoxy-D-xylulose 5-phosphate reductoisomerase [Bacteroidetes bacterium]|nr:1-deoxy-D-xylulose 5-phosphate reductoisomerase [Bacteroidota bacterium]